MSVHKISAAFGSDLNVEWPCPACGQKTLQIMKESFVHRDTLETRRMQSEDWFEPEMHASVFSCMSLCSRAQCGEVVACAGKGGWERDWDEYKHEVNYLRWYQPVSFIPCLKPFSLPDDCPEEIADPLKASFSVFLTHPGAAANLVRISVERMLTAMGVAERNEKDKRIPLHQRLEKLPATYEAFSKPLMAIKFLGNAGSHRHDEVNVADIEDAFGIMDHVVNELFSGRRESVAVLTERLHTRFQKK